MLSDLLAAFKGCDKVIFKLTGCGEQECETAEFKDAIEAIEALQQEIEKLKATLADWKYNAKCDADHIAALTADKALGGKEGGKEL